MVDLNEAYLKIKKAGSGAVRAVPMPGESVSDGLHQVEILEEGQWVSVVSGLPRTSAFDLIGRATNRTICG